MKAIVQHTYGSTDVLEYSDIERPVVDADEVLVRVRAAGVDRGVWHLMAGLPYPIRLAGYGVRAPKTITPGMDLAGIVEAVGAGITRFQPGDEVFGIGKGAYAEFARAREDKLAPMPVGLTFEQAAAVAISGLTALQSVRDHGRVQPGQRVLVIGASGGVGSYAVQIAKAYGAHVTGVCSTGKIDMVRALGADEVIDYTLADFTDSTAPFDVILDTGGNATLMRLRRALTPKGTLAIVGGETGGRWLGGFDRNLRAPMLSVFVGQRLGAVMCSENHEDLLVLKDLIEAGSITPVIDHSYPLSEAPEAIRHVAEGRARGKVVITI